ncbi:hypothetical protein WJX73_009580 [Symbiochloris irregularis]|uniref:4-alpha-glucanotransferase n=1 Tax=Symbiochloris irregularis TaxID=706552 RepID=A0AAW1NZB7_9CHLO
MSATTRSEESCITVHFRIPYMTTWGQHIRVVGEHSALGDWQPASAPSLGCRHAGEELVWEGKVSMPKVHHFSYKFAVVTDDNRVQCLERESRSVALPSNLQSGAVVSLQDEWQDKPHAADLLRTSAFDSVILPQQWAETKQHLQHLEAQDGSTIVRLLIRGWKLAPGQKIVVTGNLPIMGTWQPSHALALTEVSTPSWMTEVRVPYAAFPLTYKYAVVDSNGSCDLEAGEARLVSCGLPAPPGVESHSPPQALISVDDGYFRHSHMPRFAGVATPVFSLRTLRSVGSGEFSDIECLADLCSAIGLRLIQLLPVNDTTVYNMWWDSYPYCSVSVFALHPLYLSLDNLSESMPSDLAERVQKARQDLDLKDVDYEATLAVKLSIARELFTRQGHAQLQDPGFKAWFKHSHEWLRPYAAFCVLRDLFGTAEHWTWGAFSHGTSQVVDKILSPSQEHHSRVQFIWWLQYHLYLQLLRASDYCESKRVALKGDLPIGVDKRSVDTWVRPEQFRMDVSTGAPPDYFDANGQNWGFPTYNWEEMAKDGYAWWRNRLSCLSQYFHAYRIDHILGFFRIWEIPGDCSIGLLGHFRPSIPLTRAELESRGIWDFNRLCDPYITSGLVSELFGELAGQATVTYLIPKGTDRFELRPEFSSEKQIQAIKARDGSPEWMVAETETLKKGLMSLRHNVVLLHHESSPDMFYPRFHLMNTHSWQELDEHWQEALSWMHDDYFYGRQDALWRTHALKTLPVLQAATDMLVCGEDLGMIPACVPPIMAQLGLTGLRIQRMSAEPGREFGEPASYPYLTVASPSCHDTSTTRAWYEEDPLRRQRFFQQGLGQAGEAPAACTPDVLRLVVRQHLEANSMWAIFPLQDLMPLSSKVPARPAKEETINNPSNPKHYWRYRIHLPLEELVADGAFVAEMQAALLESGRLEARDVGEALAADVTDAFAAQNGHL